MASILNRSSATGTSSQSNPLVNGHTNNPLKIFVLAKKSINNIFKDIHSYVGECKEFLSKQNQDVIDRDQINQVESYNEMVNGIREVLARNHMKVAFFGRTSNGKSTVINAVLQNKILPAGIGHTTNCFLQVEGTDSDVGYMIQEDSPDKKLSVDSVLTLANALNSERLGDASLVKIFWPKSKCPLLHDDVVLVDSPGIDVSENLDEWIDKHCLDADVFVIVSNAESTLMRTEKNFFHRVNEKLSKPNVFILNNRWDASAAEPESQELVRKQHVRRDIDFLADELNVVNKKEAEDRVFFVSAKEVLAARLKQQEGTPIDHQSFPDGFQLRYLEFEQFERKFEECLSKSAVKTKFDQHTKRGKNLINEMKNVLNAIYQISNELKQSKMKKRNQLWDELETMKQQMEILTSEVKHHICNMVEQVENKVSAALTEEIRRLSLLVNDFERPFSSNQLVLDVYKKELHSHMEQGLGSNLRARLSTALSCNVESAQKEMIERVTTLLPTRAQNKQFSYCISPRQNFELLYRINCETLCSDFQEDLEFRFSFGIIQMIRRFTGKSPTKTNQENLNKSLSVTDGPVTPDVVFASKTEHSDVLSLIEKVSMVSPQSQTTVGLLAVSGFLVRSVGWRVIVITFGVYGLLYVYERLTWTNKAKEKEFKKQYVNHATKKLKLIVDLTSANCSHQVQQ